MILYQCKFYTQFKATVIATRNFFTSNLLTLGQTKNYYDTLGLSPKATKNQIKAAYYKLSMIYHPDQNQSDKAAKIFREISEAYEVLGDITKRRLYDRGVDSESPFSTTAAESYTQAARKTRYRSTRAAATYGRTSAYNFDAWTASHYSDTFHRQKRDKELKEKYREHEKDKNRKALQKNTVSTYFLLFATVFTIIISEHLWKRHLDSDRRQSKN